MKTLLLLAHGSRNTDANDEIRALARAVAARESGFDAVHAAFLEMTQPRIPEAIAAALDEGADELLLLPCFVAAGRHVVEDLPALLERARERHPQARIHLVEHLGARGGLLDLLVAEARSEADRL